MTYAPLTRDQHFQGPGPKRILALDGGGLRGIVALGYLRRIEEILKARHGGRDDFRLCHYFDLIAGTSTGAIIVAALALGMSVDELTGIYLRLGKEVFRRSLWRQGLMRARYRHEELSAQLQRVCGKHTTLGGPQLKTGLLVMTKRMDTGSPWPLGNNPRGRYFEAAEGDDWISNGDYPLWRVVRASAAAPRYFDPEEITIYRSRPLRAVKGVFVDGGVSPFNNPTLQAFMYATLDGYRVGWETGADKLLVVSVGTGRGDPGKEPTWIAAKGAVKSLLSLMDDAGALVETMCQWLSTGPTHRAIDSEIGTLLGDSIGGVPCFTYARYDLSLTEPSVATLKPGIDAQTLESLTAMDVPRNMPLLKELADADAARIAQGHFSASFDLG